MPDSVRDRPPLLIRPLHAWFGLWERMIPSVYRVVAVVIAAFVTAAAIAPISVVPWWIAAVVALVVWIGLAILQEHDERVVLPIDAAFEAELRRLVDPILEQPGFMYSGATGASRARGGSDSFMYAGPGDETLWIFRDPREGTLGFSAPSSLGKGVSLPTELRARAQRVIDPASDAVAVAEIMALWVQDPSLRLPHPPGRKVRYHRLGRSGWFRYERGVR